MATPTHSIGKGSYIGRFAPSPTGPLHFGSLVSALAGFLDARSHNGRWLVRIEDLDPPREQPGAATTILDCLQAHGLHWDGDVIFQSQRLDDYARVLDTLSSEQLTYPCNCSRQDIQTMGGIYDGRCRRGAQMDDQTAVAIRLKVCQLPPTYIHRAGDIVFYDIFQGYQHQHLGMDVGDFIIRRKDGFFAYQLAVVADDIAQGITHVIRGSDLLDSTPRQIFLFHLLGTNVPKFGHIPLIVNQQGQKLSKQTSAPAIDNSCPSDNLFLALQCLRHNPPSQIRTAAPTDLLQWAISHWRREKLPRHLSVEDPT